MAQLTVAEAWVERVNKNLLPLLNKFSIRRQGPFGLSNVIQPVVNVETLEEAAAAQQQRASATGSLTTAGTFISVVVPAGQVWAVEYMAAGVIMGASSVSRDSIELVAGTLNPPLANELGPGNGFTTGFSHSFNPPLVLNAGEGFFLVRRLVGSAGTAGMWVAFRQVS